MCGASLEYNGLNKSKINQESLLTATAARLTTFAELEQLPDPPGGRYELHHGELIAAPPPKQGHKLIERALRRMLEAAAGDVGVVETEYGFRPTPEFEYRVADVAVVAMKRWNEIPRNGYLMGAPEIVVEVISPSNTVSEMNEKERLCLQNGCREFWIVDPHRREVRVTTPNGPVAFYRPGDQIPLYFGGSIRTDSIFE
jgi:Uma2 family endonuclease